MEKEGEEEGECSREGKGESECEAVNDLVFDVFHRIRNMVVKTSLILLSKACFSDLSLSEYLFIYRLSLAICLFKGFTISLAQDYVGTILRQLSEMKAILFFSRNSLRCEYTKWH